MRNYVLRPRSAVRTRTHPATVGEAEPSALVVLREVDLRAAVVEKRAAEASELAETVKGRDSPV